MEQMNPAAVAMDIETLRHTQTHTRTNKWKWGIARQRIRVLRLLNFSKIDYYFGIL